MILRILPVFVACFMDFAFTFAVEGHRCSFSKALLTDWAALWILLRLVRVLTLPFLQTFYVIGVSRFGSCDGSVLQRETFAAKCARIYCWANRADGRISRVSLVLPLFVASSMVCMLKHTIEFGRSSCKSLLAE